MQLNSLIEVLNYLKDKAGDAAVTEAYARLAETVKEASKNPETDYLPSVMKAKNNLRNILLAGDPADWGYEMYDLFEKFNSGALFGKAGADYIDRLFSGDSKDWTAIHTDLGRKSKLYSKFSENLNRFIQLYDTMLPAETAAPSLEHEVSSLYLYFEGRLSVHNVTDLERYSGLWDGILDVFSKMNAEEKPELDINSYQSGRIVLEVAPGEKTMNSLMAGTTGILSIMPVILKIKNIQLELIPLPLSNSVNELLEQEIQSLINDSSFGNANKLINSYFHKKSDPDELAGDLSLALMQIYSFIEKGGKIEFRPSGSAAEAAKINRELVESYALARELENAGKKLAEELSKKDTAAE